MSGVSGVGMVGGVVWGLDVIVVEVCFFRRV